MTIIIFVSADEDVFDVLVQIFILSTQLYFQASCILKTKSFVESLSPENDNLYHFKDMIYPNGS